MAAHSGYITDFGYARAGESSRTSTQVTRDQRADMTIRLMRAAVIGGQVIDAKGEPVPDAIVAVGRVRFTRGQRRPMPTGGRMVPSPSSAPHRNGGGWSRLDMPCRSARSGTAPSSTTGCLPASITSPLPAGTRNGRWMAQSWTLTSWTNSGPARPSSISWTARHGPYRWRYASSFPSPGTTGLSSIVPATARWFCYRF